jgi:hypothetical protein
VTWYGFKFEHRDELLHIVDSDNIAILGGSGNYHLVDGGDDSIFEVNNSSNVVIAIQARQGYAGEYGFVREDGAVRVPGSLKLVSLYKLGDPVPFGENNAPEFPTDGGGGPAAALERLIAAVGAADLPRRLERRLTRKLESAFRAVTRDRIKLAILRLRPFIDEVEARRGTRIDEADADDWIADAKSIIDMLKAQRNWAPLQRSLASMAKTRYQATAGSRAGKRDA